MISVYEALNSTDAHMMAHMLQSHEISAEVTGEYLQGALGELPASGHIKVIVHEDDYIKAKEIIYQFEKKSHQPQDSQEISKNKKKLNLFAAILIFASGFITANLYESIMYHTDSYWNDKNTYSEDFDRDGIIDRKSYYVNEKIAKDEIDRNADGKIDEKSFHNKKGLLEKTEFDTNFNGTFDAVAYYDHINTDYVEYDDSTVKRKYIYKHNSLKEIFYFHPNSSIPLKIEYFNSSGTLLNADYDSDKDGKLDTHYTYDKYAEIIKTEQIK